MRGESGAAGRWEPSGASDGPRRAVRKWCAGAVRKRVGFTSRKTRNRGAKCLHFAPLLPSCPRPVRGADRSCGRRAAARSGALRAAAVHPRGGRSDGADRRARAPPAPALADGAARGDARCVTGCLSEELRHSLLHLSLLDSAPHACEVPTPENRVRVHILAPILAMVSAVVA